MKKYDINIKPLYYFIFFVIGLIFISIIGITRANALIINYNFMGQTVGNSFWLNPNTTNTAHTYATVTENSALKYLVVDVCASIDNLNNFQPLSNVPFKFYKLYDLNTTGTVSGYTCKNARLFYEITQWDDAGNGYYGINNGSLPIKNNTSYYVEARINSFGFSDSIDLGDLTVNNQNIIINGIDNIQSSIIDSENNINSNIQSSEDNINQNIDDMEQSIVDSNKETQEVIKDQFNDCRDSYNLLDYKKITTSGSDTTISIIDNGIKVAGNWAGKITINNLKPNTDYYLQYLTENIISNTKNVGVFINTSTTTRLAEFKNGVGGVFNTEEYNTITIWFYGGFGSYGEVNFTDIMLSEGNLFKKYEEYGKEICSNKIDEANETSKGIWQTIKDLPGMFLDMLLGLFIPEDLSFINEFKDVISNKLGFIASIPIQIIDFMLSLAEVTFNEITTISFPSVEIFGVHFWNAEEIDITILLEKLKPFKYFTDFTCVILCCKTLYDQYHKFSGGGSD